MILHAVPWTVVQCSSWHPGAGTHVVFLESSQLQGLYVADLLYCRFDFKVNLEKQMCWEEPRNFWKGRMKGSFIFLDGKMNYKVTVMKRVRCWLRIRPRDEVMLRVDVTVLSPDAAGQGAWRFSQGFCVAVLGRIAPSSENINLCS